MPHGPTPPETSPAARDSAHAVLGACSGPATGAGSRAPRRPDAAIEEEDDLPRHIRVFFSADEDPTALAEASMSDDKTALIKEKQDLIKKMLEMQKHFISAEHDGGVEPGNYYNPKPGTTFDGYVKEYNDIAQRVNKLAHEIKGSGHIH
jgi:hypothetical protein